MKDDNVNPECVTHETVVPFARYRVTASAFSRETWVFSAGPRTEEVNTAERLFQACRTAGDVKRAYEQFWNETNLQSKDVVRVSHVEAFTTGIDDRPSERLVKFYGLEAEDVPASEKEDAARAARWLRRDETRGSAIIRQREAQAGRLEDSVHSAEKRRRDFLEGFRSYRNGVEKRMG